jgi:NAD(P)-dependent dehydrogenase (short-subunit alcohol dehydrogenase family)
VVRAVLGSACAREFLRQGAFVSIIDIDKNSGIRLEEELLVEYPGRARFFECDLTNIDSTCSVADSTIAVFGQIDCIIYNAAIFHANSLKDWDKDDFEQLRRHFEVGILGHMNMVRHAWADCREVVAAALSLSGQRQDDLQSQRLWLTCQSKRL